MRDCIFCAIIEGAAPASFVHRDELVTAFLDIRPVTPGHLLVIPNRHADRLADVAPAEAARMFEVGGRLLAAFREGRTVRADGVNLFLADGEAAGQEVFHAHLHVIPRFADDGFVIEAAAWDRAAPTRAALDQLAGEIRRSI